MGTRGRIARPVAHASKLGWPSHGAQARRAEIVALPESRIAAPKPPAGLGPAGRATWREAWTGPSLQMIDATALRGHCQLVDDAAGLRREVEVHGRLLHEPIVTPTGRVVGERQVANPAIGLLLKTEQAISEQRAALALTPVARARLGTSLLQGRQKATVLQQLVTAAEARR